MDIVAARFIDVGSSLFDLSLAHFTQVLGSKELIVPSEKTLLDCALTYIRKKVCVGR